MWLAPEGSNKCVIGEEWSSGEAGIWLRPGWVLERKYPVTDGGEDLVVQTSSGENVGKIFLPLWRVLEIVEVIDGGGASE